jgi:hypothetical protein
MGSTCDGELVAILGTVGQEIRDAEPRGDVDKLCELVASQHL